MTTLRFVGDVSLWLGLLAALVVGALSWSYYSRESFHLPGRLRVVLPMLRSAAFALGVLILTGPVLHHRQTIGELGRVQIFLDGSQSMGQLDRQATLEQKLKVAEQLGWIEPALVDLSGYEVLARLQDARSQLSQSIEQDGRSSEVPLALNTFVSAIEQISPDLPEPIAEQFASQVITPARGLAQTAGEQRGPVAELIANTERIETTLQSTLDRALQEQIAGGDQSLASALALFDETPRWKRAELQLEASDLLADLRTTHDVQVRTLVGSQALPWNELVAESQQSASSFGRNSADPASLTDRQLSSITDLSTGVVAAQKDLSAADADRLGDRSTAIVLLSDGRHTTGPSALQTARILGGQGASFYTVGFGAQQEAPDLAITNVEYPDVVFAKDQVRGTIIINDAMPAGRPFVVEIRSEDQVLWQEELLTQSSSGRRVEFEFAIDELVDALQIDGPGDITAEILALNLEAVVVPLADEADASNNVRAMRIGAITQSHRLLILDGRPRWETRYVRNAFERDEQWDVTTIIAGPGTDYESIPRGDSGMRFPTRRDLLFDYDLILFGELAESLLTEQELDWIAEFVEVRGGGVIFVDGSRGWLRQTTQESLLKLIPVEWPEGDSLAVPASLQLTDAGAALPELRLQPGEAANQQFWSELPTPKRLVQTVALPGSEVLVEASLGGRTIPAMLTRQVGAGRVLYLAFDETWRWRYKVADKWHQRIWNQLARFTMPKPFTASDEYVAIDSGAMNYEPGSRVDLRVKLSDLDGRPASDRVATAVIWRDGKQAGEISLAADENVPGLYRGRTGPLTGGDYEISVRASGYGSDALRARSSFHVQQAESAEMLTTSVNESLLRQMAEASGGTYLREDEIGALKDLLAPLSNGRVVETETALWQSYWWFVAMIGLLTAEWILRKRSGLL